MLFLWPHSRGLGCLQVEAHGLEVKVQDVCLLHDVPRPTAGHHKKASSANH